ncbi:MAG: DUF2306 domain-containing protein [Planctomycetes bacterium]|nr:DUF2306 domain-containing protein [Planctomycetota bacterium]
MLTTLQRCVVLLTGLLILKVTAAVILGYRDYFPPDFQSDFLRGRECYFFQGYCVAFYVHLAAGPVSLVLGLVLVSRWLLRRFPTWHRWIGRVQAINVLLFLLPSGSWMGLYASAGPVATLSFSVLSVLTAFCVVIGWRHAVQRRFALHQLWMGRCFLLLCAAVVIRIIGGAATELGVDAPWFNPVAAWASWLVPLSVFELIRVCSRGRWLQFRPPTAGLSTR